MDLSYDCPPKSISQTDFVYSMALSMIVKLLVLPFIEGGEDGAIQFKAVQTRDLKKWIIIPSAMLCQICQLTFRGQRERPKETKLSPIPYNHHQSTYDVRAAASQGCHFCTILWTLLSTEERSTTIGYGQNPANLPRLETDYVQIVPTNFPDSGTRSLEIAFPLEFPDWAGRGRFCNKSLELFPADEVDHSISSHETHTSTGSDSNIALASKWLNDCSAKHSICHSFEGGQGPWYPTRLLDVGKHVEESDVRLVISDTDSPTGPYLTLSHCWGSALVSKLEMRDLEKSKAGISASALPKTFRDAVYVTKKLGVQYLWIDALCIIQDSVEDWRQETATMGKVYKNALCNIAATGASDSSIGCFWDRNPLLAQPCKIEFQWDLPLKGSFYCVDASLWPKNIGEAPLNRRAWVTQERMLSPRILHFGMQQMFWECRAMEACEAFPGGLPKALDPLTFIVRTGLKRMQPFVRENENNLSEELEDLGTDGYEYWDGILDVYTRSSLTRPEDKLIALSGLVKETSLLLKDNNLAGLWKNRFASELLWSVFKPNIANNGTPSFRPEIYRAPTWSWASIDGQVVTGNRDPNNWRLLPTLLEGHIVPAGADPTGQVSNGHIQAQGLLRPVTWDCLWSGRIYKLLLDGITPDHSTFSPDEILGLPSGEVYCFPILDRYVETTRIVDGLVLVRSTNVHSNNEFKRIGTFRYQDEEECWLLMKRQRPGSTQWPLYDDIEEYSFTII